MIWAGYVADQFTGAFDKVLKYLKEDFIDDFGDTIFIGFANIGVGVFNLIGYTMDFLNQKLLDLGDWWFKFFGGEEAKQSWIEQRDKIFGDLRAEEERFPGIPLVKMPGTEDIETFEDVMDQTKNIVQGVVDKVVETNATIIASDNAVDKNREDLSKKNTNRITQEFKLTKDIVASRSKAGKQFVADLQMMGEKSESMKKVFKKAAIAETLASTYAAAQDQFAAFSKDFPAPLGMILGVAAAAAAISAGLLRVQEIKKAQYGANFITSGPQMMMVGEGSAPEHVQVTPLGDSNIDGGPTQRPIILNIEGNVMHESFVEDDIIPAIREGLRLGENMGI